MTPYTIEVVCAANIARSPMAEAIGNSIISEHGLADHLQVVSSGVRVNTPLDFEHAARYIRLAAELPAQYGPPTSSDQRTMQDWLLEDKLSVPMRYGVDVGYRDAFNAFSTQRREALRTVGRELRDAALGEIGLRVTTDRVQTIARPDVTLVLGLDTKVADAANRIYREGGRPEMCAFTLGQYAGIGTDIEDPVGSTNIQRYRELRNDLAERMATAIDLFTQHRGLR